MGVTNYLLGRKPQKIMNFFDRGVTSSTYLKSHFLAPLKLNLSRCPTLNSTRTCKCALGNLFLRSILSLSGMLIQKRSQVSSKSSWYVQLEITDFPEAFNLFFHVGPGRSKAIWRQARDPNSYPSQKLTWLAGNGPPWMSQWLSAKLLSCTEDILVFFERLEFHFVVSFVHVLSCFGGCVQIEKICFKIMWLQNASKSGPINLN